MAIIWTKDWEASDDGTVLKAVDLKNIQDDINTTGLADADSIRGVPVVAPVPGDDGKALTYDDSVPEFNYTSLSGLPAGIYLPYGGTAAPSGWQLCDGTAVLRATFVDLFAAIGTTFGVGDGSTTFNLPDIRGRGAIGIDNMGGSSADVITDAAADTEGGTFGAETHTLMTSEIPSHAHDDVINDGISSGAANVSERTGPAATGVTGSGFDSGSTGGGMAHNNLPPGLASNWIIKN